MFCYNLRNIFIEVITFLLKSFIFCLNPNTIIAEKDLTL